MTKITDRFVREMPCPSNGYMLVRDDELIGFGVRKTAAGCTSFILNYVIAGRERRTTIGQYPTWSVATAREEARRLRRIVDTGGDPLGAKDAARAELNVLQLWARYKTDVLPRKALATQRNERGMWDRHILPELGKLKLSAVDPATIDRLHIRMSSATPILANRCLASINHVFTTAVRWRLLSSNPAATTKKNSEHGRERYLSPNELARLLNAMDARRDTSSLLAIRFLLQTGARRGEVLSATWDQFDLDAGVWTKPSSHTKQRRIHRVPLSSQAIETLSRARRMARGDHVFPGRNGGALVEVKKLFAALLGEADISNFRIHDLRHSFASFLAADGASLPIIGRLLGHTQVSTTGRYAHLQDADLREATNRIWSARRH